MKAPETHPAERLSSNATLDDVRDAAAGCRACDLWRHATQTVFGAGAEPASIMLVGEQPGDQEDLAGQPFVGPAGRLLDEALAAAGLNRARVYVTNAVKHFKWTERGKRRIHKKPRVGEILACRPWLLLELARVRPRVVVCLGTSAARAVLGQSVTLKAVRGRAIASAFAPVVYVTTHPSAILRERDSTSRAKARTALVADLAAVAAAVKKAR
jgi:uracil-DNA glycosylase family protein